MLKNIKKGFASVDLTTGTVWKRLLIFFLPIAFSTCIQQLYNTVDGLIVSKFVGTIALASVGGSSAQIINLLIGIFVSITAGASVVMAQLFGAKRYEDVNKAIGTSIVISLIAGVVIGIIGIILSPVMLAWFKAPEETIEQSLIYLRIYFIGVPFVLAVNMESNALRATGDSKNPFIFMLISCLYNIIMDLVVVIAFNLGVAGVAIATVLAQVLNFILLTFQLFRKKNIHHISFSDLSIKGKFLPRMLQFGIPNGIQSLMYSISNAIVQIGVNALGTVGVASWAMTGKVDGLFWALSNALGAAITAFIGQNIGAHDDDRVTKCVRQGIVIGFIMTIGVSALIMFISKPILPLFTDDVEVIDLTYKMLWYFVPFYFTWTLIEVLTAVLRGVGDVVIPVIILGVCICLFRIVWIYTIHAYFNTLASLCLVYIASWVFTSIVLVLYYKKSKWKDRTNKIASDL